MNTFRNKDGKNILLKIVLKIHENREYLSQIDGAIGDGDHGMNMNKGFMCFYDRINDCDCSFTEGLKELGTILFDEIGGSMGPIYGTIFSEMAENKENNKEIQLKDFGEMLEAGLRGLYDIVEAREGDKTLVDTLSPAIASIQNSINQNENFESALEKMKIAAQKGKDSTKNMIAKFGRSSHLGERSRGVLDAGAVSCYLILEAMAEGICELLN